jgi:imidazolonepropionase-like amidohydrolase
LSPDDALAALTIWPAEILGMDKQAGSLVPGKLANFFIADTNIFAVSDPILYETWVSGQRFSENEFPEWDPTGTYALSPPQNGIADLLIGGKNGKWSLKVITGSDTLDGKISIDGRKIELDFPIAKAKEAAHVRLAGLSVSPSLQGNGENASGDRINWTASRSGDWQDPKEKPHKAIKPEDLSKVPAIRFPNKAFGQAGIPPQQTVLIQNVTLWTNTPAGVVEGADIVISEGKIKAVGKNLLRPPKAVIIDGTGKHLSPGIIDEHSHIGVSKGVNEGSHAVTSEVRIGDVINCEDINIYRQMAGGVTTSQLLHGSANPIGGQSAIIKLRWGADPEAMKFEGAAPFIKFALGENVKQSNWGDDFRSRYPQSRIGVEQLIRDAFQAALDYRNFSNAADSITKLPPRRDLQMEALLEILDSKRFVTCHSYQQAEITMLMRLAESFNFRINTFTHILEGYKVADKMQKHGVSGSTFSDWWAYKYEVIDAIPYNAALMASQGVNVCINSDDAEMGRRLNQEAAKMIKYGGVSEEEALKMVTLNPAKALHLDQWVGSLEEGKHADLVLWSDHPLSVYARPLHTYIDGRLYFDSERDEELQAYLKSERKRLIQKMMAEPDKDKKKPPASKEEKLYDCETLESEYNH